ncbi:hypothetical protein DSO57_1006290 [Entomophthora muscae]|uniref:Uncharacterized protein n=1 Tax=Entomophthora muscae TaxID=34485 RepID=A0ACC2SKC0_9FUNG|nr:hypothetical protein DSO57_1006290 [Entomophthora muscae]
MEEVIVDISWVTSICSSQRPQAACTVTVRIDNSLPLETRAQGQDLSPEPEFLQAAGPMDQKPVCLRFSDNKPPQAEAPSKSQSQNTSAGSTMVVPKEELLELPNGGREGASLNFMNLKSSQVTIQIQLPKENTGFGPNPVTTAQNKENQVTNLDILTNERTPCQGTILPLLQPGLLVTCPHFPNILMKPYWKILSLEAGCYICI